LDGTLAHYKLSMLERVRACASLETYWGTPGNLLTTPVKSRFPD